nr:hypothetical protein [Tanacetum cinerariifolium]
MIKITKHECLKPLQSRLSSTRSCQSNKNVKNLETSTLEEIVSLEKSNKNVIGLRIRDGFKVADGYANNEGKEILEEHWKEFFYEWECRAPGSQDSKHKESTRRIVPVETPASSALVSCDGLEVMIGVTKLKKVQLTLHSWLTLLQVLTLRKIYASKPNLSRLEDFVNEPIVSEPIVKKHVVKTSEAKASTDKPKVVSKNFGSPLIEVWISDSEDEDESKPKIEKKKVKPNFAKI